MPTSLQYLWASTAQFYKRFNVEDTPPLRRQRVLAEEFLEVIQASTLHNCELIMGEEIDPQSLEHLVEEVADLFVTACGLLMAHGIALSDLEQAMIEVAQKNDAKTNVTHFKDAAGKISRRAPSVVSRTIALEHEPDPDWFDHDD